MKATPKKTSPAKIQLIKDQIKAGYSADYGFLHIPKTGGSGVNAFGKSLVERGYRFPCIFGHGWKVEEILTHFPKLQLTFVLRDPLSRMVSGFNSRIRQGRPTYNSIWTPGEAAAFSIFPSVKHLLDGIVADDEYSKSSVAFTMRRVRHLHWNYGYYFKNTETVASNRSRFRLIGTMDTFETFIEELTALIGAPQSLANELYEKRHESGTNSKDLLQGYSPQEKGRIRNFLRKDYRIYSELVKIAGVSDD